MCFFLLLRTFKKPLVRFSSLPVYVIVISSEAQKGRSCSHATVVFSSRLSSNKFMTCFLNLGFTWINFNYKVCDGALVWLFSRCPVSCPRTSTANTPSDFSHLCRARNDCVFLGLLLIVSSSPFIGLYSCVNHLL